MKVFAIIFTLLSLLYAFFIFHPIDLTTEDFGRHLKNGELVFQYPALLRTNFYSYVQPDHIFINHHWLSGVIFYLVERTVNVRFLMVLVSVVFFATLYFLFYRVVRRGGLIAASLLMPFATLFLAERHGIRPEVFGLALISYFLFQMDKIEKHRNIPRYIYILFPLLMLMWVNLHLSFIFGVYIVGTFMLPELVRVLQKRQVTTYFRSLILLLVLMSTATLFNPSGLAGALYPFNIFTNYGYDIVENKSLFFLYSRIYDPGIQLYAVFASFVVLSGIVRSFLKQKRNLGEFFRVITGVVLGLVALRNLPIFALLSFPFLAESLVIFYRSVHLSQNTKQSLKILVLSIAFVSYLSVMFLVSSSQYHPLYGLSKLGIGYVKNQFASADFYKSLQLKGTMFNNYDIGSYLIYTLYPTHKVFVDNRPEAYSYDFFKRIYIPMQENDTVWQVELKKYDFQSIFFGHRDLTPWAQTFLAKRLTDPDWKPVYIDEMAIIFVRDTPQHAEIIRSHPITTQDLVKYLQISQ